MDQMKDVLDNNLIFYTLEDLKVIYNKSKEWKVIVWGTGEVAEAVYQTLISNNILVYAFGDNATNKQQKILHGKKIISPLEAANIEGAFVVIGSFSFRPILEQLTTYNIQNIFALIDSVKYPYTELLEENKLLIKYFKDYELNKSNKILVESYGNIGDTITRGGIFNALIAKFGVENLYFLVESQVIADFIRFFSNQVIVLEKKKAELDAEYRFGVLKILNKQYFKMSIILGDIRLHAIRRILNCHNFNVQEIHYHTCLPKNNYLLKMDIDYINCVFMLNSSTEMLAKGCIKDVIKKVELDFKLPTKYVVANMGATKQIRHYDVVKFSKVIEFLLEADYTVIMIGDGEFDENYYSKLKNILINIGVDTKIKLISYISKLDLQKSFNIILNAEFFVGTESGMWNASYILDVPSVVIYGGGDYGNFKHKDKNIHYVTIDDKSCFGCKWYCNNYNKNGYAKCIDDVTPSMVIDKIKEITNSDNSLIKKSVIGEKR